MVYARFSDNDWSNSNKAHYMLSDRERSQANNLRADAWRAVKVCPLLVSFWSWSWCLDSLGSITQSIPYNTDIRSIEFIMPCSTVPSHTLICDETNWPGCTPKIVIATSSSRSSYSGIWPEKAHVWCNWIHKRILIECVIGWQETDDRTRRRQAENTKKLANRRDDIHFWKQELLNEIRAMENETENLQVSR